MRRALKIDEASFGPDHPDVATDLNNLAQLLQENQPPSRGRAAVPTAVAYFHRIPSIHRA